MAAKRRRTQRNSFCCPCWANSISCACSASADASFFSRASFLYGICRYRNTSVQYSGKSPSSAVSAVRWGSSSLKMSISVTVTKVCSAIMGMASTASVTSCTVSPLPLSRW